MADDTEVNVKIVASTSDFKSGIDAANQTFTQLRSSLGNGSDAMKQASAQLNKLVSDFRAGKVGADDFRSSLSLMGGGFSSMKGGASSAESAAVGLTHATAGVTREIIVLGHEVASGNFSRMPGSLLVLASRMGALNLATLGTVGGVAALGIAFYEAAESGERSNQANLALQNSMTLAGKGAQFNTQALSKQIEQLHMLPGVSLAAARSMEENLVGSAKLSGNQIQWLIDHVLQFAKATGQDVPKAMENLSASLENPFGEYSKLQSSLALLSNKQIQSIENFKKTGDAASAASVIMQAFSSRLSDIKTTMTPLEESSNSLKKSWDTLLQSFGSSGAIENANNLLSGMLSYVADLITGIGQLPNLWRLVKQEVNDATKSTLDQQIETDALITQMYKFKDAKKDAAEQKIYNKDQINPMDQAAADANKKTQPTNDPDAIAKLAYQEEMAKEATRIKQEQLQEQNAEARAGFNTDKELLEAQRAAGQITYQQMYEDLRAMTDKEYDVEKQNLEKELALYDQKSVAYAKVNDQILLLAKQHQLALAQITKQEADDNKRELDKQQADWDKAFSHINSTVSSSLLGMINKTRTWQQTVGGIIDQFFENFVKYSLQTLERWIFVEQTKTAATVAGNTERTAADTAGAGAGEAAQGAAAQKSIGTSAAQAAAAVYADVAEIPYVGWLLAPPAAATAFAAVEAFGGSIPSAAGGWEVPHDTLAMVHKDEKILPANVSKKIDNMTGGSGGDTHVHFNVSAIDAKGVKAFMMDNSHHIANAVSKQVRQNNRGLAVH